MVWPKLTVSNYPEMLRKLSAAVFIISVACIALLRVEIAPIDQLSSQLDIDQIKVWGQVSVSFGTVAVASVIAVISDAIKLHEKISNLLCVRSVFDCRWILMPTALCSGAVIESHRIRRLTSDCETLMRNVFYEYAASSSAVKIESHLITQALTSWSWYWTCIEATVVIITTAIILT
jgi:hypothetical protein